MKFGLFAMNTGCCSYPNNALRIAQAAEAAGFESLWCSDHIVFPDPPIKRFPTPAKSRLIEALVMLSFLAGHTTKVKLGTGVIVLPQRNPLVLAKQVASVDELSGGRLMFGLGVGHLEPEFEALGAPFRERGARADEYLAAMRALWRAEKPAYQGRFVSFANIQSYPRRDIPVVVGGSSPAALRRAVRSANGWYGFSQDLHQAEKCIMGLRRAADQVDRPAGLGNLEISISPPQGPVDRKTVEGYAALGVERLILHPLADDVDGREAFVTDIAALVDALGEK